MFTWRKVLTVFTWRRVLIALCTAVIVGTLGSMLYIDSMITAQKCLETPDGHNTCLQYADWATYGGLAAAVVLIVVFLPKEKKT